jgi:hypothetical protein
VVIDDSSRNGHYGAETAGPVVERVLQQALEARGVPKNAPSLDKPGQQLAQQPAQAQPGQTTRQVLPTPPPSKKRPTMMKGTLR